MKCFFILTFIVQILTTENEGPYTGLSITLPIPQTRYHQNRGTRDECDVYDIDVDGLDSLKTNDRDIKRILTVNYESEAPAKPDNDDRFIVDKKILSFDEIDDKNDDGSELEYDTDILEENIKRPCAVIVMSNVRNPSMQTLLRKYRYDANGVLIPNSVKYFIKMPQGLKDNPILVPLNDKAFSPQGGFVRYYKEVPPIPRAW